jgi:dTDP-4-dehydrorhamnose 3,5-epimerase
MESISGWLPNRGFPVPFEFRELDIPGLLLIEPKVFSDDRGFFLEIYKHSEFINAGVHEHFVQDNFSRSSEGVLRGLHYQKDPRAQGKLVRCMKGSIFDVAVDIRKGSPTYARWVGQELSERNNLMLYVPAGFAHGFLTLSETAEVLYKCTAEYSLSDDRGIIWNDPDINIAWGENAPILSAKDGMLPILPDAENTFRYVP